MKYSFAVVPVLAATAAAQASSATAALSAIAAIQSGTDKLSSALAGYKAAGCATANGPLNTDSSDLVSVINSGDAAVTSQGKLATPAALELANPVQTLASHVSAAINAAVSQKAALVSGGLGPAVYSALLAQQTAASKFSSDLSGEVPEGLQPVAQQLAAPIASYLSSGVAAFADATNSPTACGAGGASSTSAGSSSSSASSASGSSSSASGSSSAASSTSSGAVVGGGSGSSSTVATTTSAASSSSSGTSPSQATGTIVTGGAAQVAVSGAAGALALLAVLGL